MKKIITMKKRKPGPKPMPSSALAKARNYSYPARQLEFLDSIPAPGPSKFIQGLIDESPEYQEYIRKQNDNNL